MHSIAIIRAAENYHNLSEGFADVFAEINELIENPEVTINEEKYTIIFYLCCDYKVKKKIYIAIIILYNAHSSLQELSCVQMLLELLGLNRANSTYACVWCDVSKDQR